MDKKKWRQILLWRPGNGLTAAGMLLALLLLLVPLVRLCFYTIPWYDDYLYGLVGKRLLEQDRSLWSAVRGAVITARTEWYAFQGTFSSDFLMALVPCIWGEAFYFLGPLSVILLFSGAVFLFTDTLARAVLKTTGSLGIILSCIVSALLLELIYTARQGYYWYIGAIHYVGMHAFLLLLLAAWVRVLAGCGKCAAALLMLWSVAGAVLVGGSNYVTVLQGAVLLVSLLALGALRKNKRTLLLVPSFLVYVHCMLLNVLAPGNAVRGAAFDSGSYGAVRAILNSFVEAFLHIGKFTGWITVVFLLLLFPFVWQAVRGSGLSFRFPLLVVAWSFCVYATGFTPSLYAMGHAGLSRTLNAVKITYQLLLVLDFVYVTGWLSAKLSGARGRDVRAPWFFYPVIGGLVLLCFAAEPNQAGSFSSYGAYYYIHTGEAHNLHAAYEERIQEIKQGGAQVTVKPYHFRPWFLCPEDLSDDASAEQNRAIAEWYGKDAVSCVE